MEERDFFDEKPEQRTHTMTCPHCGQPGEYQIGWLVRRKKAQLPRGADERDRARFAKAQSYMVRTDDLVGCKNIRCRKRFDVAGNPVRRLPLISPPKQAGRRALGAPHLDSEMWAS